MKLRRLMSAVVFLSAIGASIPGYMHAMAAPPRSGDVEKLIAKLDGDRGGRKIGYCMPLPRTPVDDAYGRLANIGAPAVPNLIAHLDDKLKWRRLWCVDLLGKIGDKSAVGPLVARLRVEDRDGRLWIAIALGSLRDPQAIPALAKLLGSPPQPFLGQPAGYRTEGPPAADALALMGDAGVKALEAALADGSPNVRANAAYGLAATKDARVGPALVTALKDRDAQVRIQAAYGLGSIPGLVGAKELVAETGSANDDERYGAHHALVAKGANALAACRAGLRNANARIRVSSVDCLVGAKDRGSLPLLLALVHDAAGSVRAEALVGASELDPAAAWPHLRAAAVDRSADVRAAVANGLGHVRRKEVLPYLLRLARDPDGRVRVPATMSLGEVDAPGVTQLLIAALSNRDTSVAWAAAQALGQRKDRRSVPELLAATRSRDAGLRAAAAEALGNIGDRRALPRLRAMEKDEDDLTQLAAFGAVDQINGRR